MRLTVAITLVVVAMLIGNGLFIVAAVIGATVLVVSGPVPWARFRAALHAPAGQSPTGVLPPDDDPDFLRWLTERNQRQRGDDVT